MKFSPPDGHSGFLRLVGATLLALTLAACGGGSDTGTEGGGGATGDHITGTVGGTTLAATQHIFLYEHSGGGGNKFFSAGAFNGESKESAVGWVLSNVPATVDTHACQPGDPDFVTSIKFKDSPDQTWATSNEGGSCSITVTRVTGEFIEGTFTATLVVLEGADAPPRTVTHGSFHLTRNYIAATVNGAEIALTDQVDSDIYTDDDDVELLDLFAYSSDQRWRVQGFPAAVGTYSCGPGKMTAIKLSSDDTAPFEWQAFAYADGWTAGTACSVEVTRVTDGFIEGRFSATMLSAEDWTTDGDGIDQPEGETLTRSVTNGTFRVPLPFNGGGPV